MTENRCIEVLKKMKHMFTETCAKIDENTALDMAVETIREIQQYRAIGTVEELQKSVKEEDILKFYYIKSEDKYVVGQRVDTMYYAEVGKTGLCFYMSRYLPWGEHVVAPDTLWKEHTYPSEPEEIPFFDWLQGFMKKEYGGTIEEFKALKEKNEPKKIEKRGYVFVCPICKKWLQSQQENCHGCGQKLDWSE